MRSNNRKARGVGMAVGAALAAALAATPGVASADPVSPLDANVAAASVDGVTGTLGTFTGGPVAGPDIAISFSGIRLLQEGTATANSGFGDVAIALGPGSEATATGGIFDSAFADGTGGVFGPTTAIATDGSFDSAFADGTASDAFAGHGSFDSATAGEFQAAADAGFGNGDVASIFGVGSAVAQFGNGDLASIYNPGGIPDLASAGGTSATVLGSNDIASVFDPAATIANPMGSSADAGANLTTPGSFDLAAVFGDMLHAVATGGNFLIDIVPSL